MATAFESEAHIRRPIEEVWAVLVDWARAPEWMAGIDAISAAGDVAVGTRLTFTARGKERPAEIVELDVGRRLSIRSEQGPVTATYRYELEPSTEAATWLRLRADCEVRGPLGVLAPLIRRTLRRTDGGQPAALERLLGR
ncbi:MAG: SRPBCC family protein [Actinomycetota bacterium]